MKWSGLVVLTVLITGLASGDDKRPADRAPATPPVLRSDRAEDSVIVTLPGGPVSEKPAKTEEASAPEAKAPAAPATDNAAAAAATTAAPASPDGGPAVAAVVSGWGTAKVPATAADPPAAANSATPPALTEAAAPPAEPPATDTTAAPPADAPAAPDPPAPAPTPAIPAKPAIPLDFQADAGVYCQKRIGQWHEAEALALLGDATGRRASLDENNLENGQILSFSDPTGRYRQLELDFDKEHGQLRTVFVYPKNLSWNDCRHLFGGKVNASLANKGRRFYSYVDKRLDVLVDPSGKVISLGLY